jgi:alkanesulfonate monooxygenase SsuD/methylene tetrahydromethanopterin reductase-like flavin-dependent oxidoreductase (luciferase family)
MRHALHVPNFAAPGDLVELGVTAERSGWDGVLLWDHVFGGPGFAVPMADPWVTLGALATATSRVRLGTAVTPVPRRRPAKLAREVATLDHLSGGRAVLGVGLGNPPQEYTAFGESAKPADLASRLDEGLEVLAGLWSGEPFSHDGTHETVDGAQFLPVPVQGPRPPVWVACLSPPGAGPVARAARWDGAVLAAMTDAGGIDPVPVEQVRAVRDEVSRRRGGLDGFALTVVSAGPPDAAVRAGYEEAGVDWVLVTGGPDQVRELAAASP